MSRQLVPWRRRSPLFDLHRDLDEMFGGFWERPGLIPEEERTFLRDFQPHMDVSESDDAYAVAVELPGLEKKDIDLSITDDLLVIQGEKRAEAEEDDEERHRVERLYGRFQRAVRLPTPVEANRIEASFKDGVLRVRLPKAAEAAQRKVPIEVQGS